MSTGDFHLKTTDGNGTTRDYEVLVPNPYSPNTPLAVTFVYHGAGSSEAESKAYGVQGGTGAATSSIFVFPQGINYGSYGVGWDDSCAGRDVVFFDHMLQNLEANYCVDSSRVFAAGFSWGCDHVTSLACCRGSNIRAIAAASCSDDFQNTADYRTYINSPCPSSTKVGIRFTYDPNGDAGYSAQDFATTLALYRSWDGCGTASVTAGACLSYQGCARPMLDCRYPVMGHTQPANWGKDTWSFFASF
jgi:poly(3-hydroxybutyrate) depolymerase